MLAFSELMLATMAVRQGSDVQNIEQLHTRFHQACYDLGCSGDRMAARFQTVYPRGGPEFSGPQQDAHEFMLMLLEAVDEDQELFAPLSQMYILTAKDDPKLKKDKVEPGLPVVSVPLDGRGFSQLLKPTREEMDADNAIDFDEHGMHEAVKVDSFSHPNPGSIKLMNLHAKAFGSDLYGRSHKKTEEARNLVLKHPFEKLPVTVMNSTTQREETLEVEIVSMVAHIGSAANSGHYVAYEKKDGQWYLYNDNYTAKVADIKEEFRRNPGMVPYVMSYQNSNGE